MVEEREGRSGVEEVGGEEWGEGGGRGGVGWRSWEGRSGGGEGGVGWRRWE